MEKAQQTFNIKTANFIVENAFYNNTKKIEDFEAQIKQIGTFIKQKMLELNYDTNSNIAKNFAIYQFFTDTMEIKSRNLRHLPFKYDFEDYFGREDYSKQFVNKLLETNSGQCHSLPLLYLIIAEEIGAEAYLSFSPQHSYIKFQDDDGKYYSAELTNGMLISDIFLMQSGYIKSEALQNKIYMQPLTNQQLLAHVFCDLAHGYIAKFCMDDFVYSIINTALDLDPTNISAQMLKSNYLSSQFQYFENQLGIKLNEQNFRYILEQYPRAKRILIARNEQYEYIDNLGYVEMPLEAYKTWLGSLKAAENKQESQKIFIKLNEKIKVKN